MERPQTLTTIPEAADIADIPYKRLWEGIHYWHCLPGPSVKHGKRFYYDECGLEQLLEAIKERRRK